MSAFLCSDVHTVVLALYACSRVDQGARPATVRDVAHSLRRLNNYALSARYSDDPVSLEWTPQTVASAENWLSTHNSIALRDIAQCFEYQCSEGDSEAQPEWPLLRAIVDLATADVPAGFKNARSGVWSI